MDLDQSNAIVGLALGLIALLGVVGGWLRWVRPRIRAAKNKGALALYSIIGRDAIIEPTSGREIAPALPGIGVRMENVERAQERQTAAIERVAALMESQQQQDRRLDDHEKRLGQLEEQAIERIAAKAESVAAWRAVEKIAESSPPAPATDVTPDDLPELD